LALCFFKLSKFKHFLPACILTTFPTCTTAIPIFGSYVDQHDNHVYISFRQDEELTSIRC
jgi:hypothetical protein